MPRLAAPPRSAATGNTPARTTVREGIATPTPRRRPHAGNKPIEPIRWISSSHPAFKPVQEEEEQDDTVNRGSGTRSSGSIHFSSSSDGGSDHEDVTDLDELVSGLDHDLALTGLPAVARWIEDVDRVVKKDKVLVDSLEERFGGMGLDDPSLTTAHERKSVATDIADEDITNSSIHDNFADTTDITTTTATSVYESLHSSNSEPRSLAPRSSRNEGESQVDDMLPEQDSIASHDFPSSIDQTRESEQPDSPSGSPKTTTVLSDNGDDEPSCIDFLSSDEDEDNDVGENSFDGDVYDGLPLPTPSTKVYSKTTRVSDHGRKSVNDHSSIVDSASVSDGSDFAPQTRTRGRLRTRGEILKRKQESPSQSTLLSSSPTPSSQSVIVLDDSASEPEYSQQSDSSISYRRRQSGIATASSTGDIDSFIVHDSDSDQYVYRSSTPEDGFSDLDVAATRNKRVRSTNRRESSTPSSSSTTSDIDSIFAPGYHEDSLINLQIRDSSPSTNPSQDLCDRLGIKLDRFEFDRHKEELVMHLFRKFDNALCGGRLSVLTKPKGLSIIWSSQLTKTGGWIRCRDRKRLLTKAELARTANDDVMRLYDRFHSTDVILPPVLVKLSNPLLYSNPARIISVFAHEFCHLTTVAISHQYNRSHSGAFLTWGAKMSQAFRGIKVETYHDYKTVPRYRYRCTNCSRELERHVKITNGDPRCRACGLVWIRDCYLKHPELLEGSEKTEQMEKKVLMAYRMPDHHARLVDVTDGLEKEGGGEVGSKVRKDGRDAGVDGGLYNRPNIQLF